MAHMTGDEPQAHANKLSYNTGTHHEKTHQKYANWTHGMYILTHKYTSMCMYKDINPRKKAIITDVFRILRTQITKMLMEA